MTQHLAHLEFRDRLYYVRSDATPLDSPIIRLIEGIYATEPQDARKILRSRIFATENPSQFALGMIKVSAKRWSPIPRVTQRWAPPDGAVDLSLASTHSERGSLRVKAGEHLPPEKLRDFFSTHLDAGTVSPLLYERDRSVVAVLLDRDFRTLAAAKNTNASERTHHAEINLIRNYLAQGNTLPAGFIVATSLKPCRMCAGLLWEAAGPTREFQVIYRDFDPGPQARVTLLDPGYERSLEQICNPQSCNRRISGAG